MKLPTDYCPLCHQELIMWTRDAFTTIPDNNLYECLTHLPPAIGSNASRTHYFVITNRKGEFLKSEVCFKGLTLIYYHNDPQTVIFNENGHLLSVDTIFPIDFLDLNKTVERIKTLVTFS